MSLLIFSGLAAATALLSLNVFGTQQPQLKPAPVRVRARHNR